MGGIRPQVPLLWLGPLFWWGAFSFPNKSSSFSVFMATHASNRALLPQVRAALWEVLSSWFGSRAEEERNSASHIFLTAFPFTDVFSHTTQRSHSGRFENVWEIWECMEQVLLFIYDRDKQGCQLKQSCWGVLCTSVPGSSGCCLGDGFIKITSKCYLEVTEIAGWTPED